MGGATWCNEWDFKHSAMSNAYMTVTGQEREKVSG